MMPSDGPPPSRKALDGLERGIDDVVRPVQLRIALACAESRPIGGSVLPSIITTLVLHAREAAAFHFFGETREIVIARTRGTPSSSG